MEVLDEVDECNRAVSTREVRRRNTLVPHCKWPWTQYIGPMIADHTPRQRFRVPHADIIVLVPKFRWKLERGMRSWDDYIAELFPECQIAMILRCGRSPFEMMDGQMCGRSTAYAVKDGVLEAFSRCDELARQWPSGDGVTQATARFKQRTPHGASTHAVGAVDAMFVRIEHATVGQHCEPRKFHSMHKNVFGMNFQVSASDG